MAPPHRLAVGLSDEREVADGGFQRNVSDWKSAVQIIELPRSGLVQHLLSRISYRIYRITGESKGSGMTGFWKAALGVGGLATVGLFVLYKLYDRIISLGILIGLSQSQSFIVVIVLSVLIFLVGSSVLHIHVVFKQPDWGWARRFAPGHQSQSQGSRIREFLRTAHFKLRRPRWHERTNARLPSTALVPSSWMHRLRLIGSPRAPRRSLWSGSQI